MMKEKASTYFELSSVVVFYPSLISVYRKAIYVYLIVFTLLQLPYAQYTWGQFAMTTPVFYEGNWVLQSLNILAHRQWANYYPLFISVLLMALVFSFFVKKKRLLSMLIYFCVSNLYHRTISIQNGGGDLLQLQLFFLMLMNENSSLMKEGRLKTISIALTNVAFLASQLQVVMVYVVSSWFKLQGSQWLDGSALHYVLMNDEYTLEFIKSTVPQIEIPLKILTWLTLLFQLCFPVFIWFKKLKPYLFTFGIIMHLMIAFVMGITDFGILMLVMYLLFSSEEWCSRLLKKNQLNR